MFNNKYVPHGPSINSNIFEGDNTNNNNIIEHFVLFFLISTNLTFLSSLFFRDPA